MIIAIIAIFCAGIANFAMHRAVMESRDPLVRQIVDPLHRRIGPHASYVLEFLLLVGALALVTRSWFVGLMLYGLYTLFNALSYAWITGQPGDR